MQKLMIDLKNMAFPNDILDVEETGTHEITIILQNDADVRKIIHKVNEIDSSLFHHTSPVLILYVYENGRIFEP